MYIFPCCTIVERCKTPSAMANLADLCPDVLEGEVDGFQHVVEVLLDEYPVFGVLRSR